MIGVGITLVLPVIVPVIIVTAIITGIKKRRMRKTANDEVY